MNLFAIALALLIPAVVLALLLHLSQRRAWGRNARHLCGRCGGKLPHEEHYRVQGVLVCPACAKRTRRLIQGSAVIGGATLALFNVMLIMVTIRSWTGGQGIEFFPPVFGLGLTAAVILLWRSVLESMRASNVMAAEEEEREPQIGSLSHALRVRDAVLASGVPFCEWMAGKADQMMETPRWRSRGLLREISAHMKTCETCLRSRAISDAALIMIPPSEP